MTMTLNFAASASVQESGSNGLNSQNSPLITFETTEINGEKSNLATEGDSIAFVFKATPIPTEAVTFKIKINDKGEELGIRTDGENDNSLQGNEGVHRITMLAGEDYARIRFQTEDDAVPEPTSAIDVRILSGVGYRVDKSSNFGSVKIESDDKIQISLHPVYSAIRHGDDAWFKLQALEKPFIKTRVKIEITGSRNVLKIARYMKIVNMPVGIRTMYFRVSTLNSGLNHFSGAVTATILDQPSEDFSYVASGESEEKSVVVRVGDRKSLPVISLKEIRVNGQSGKFGEEGDRVTFVFRADPVPIYDTEIDVRVSESGSFVGQLPGGSSDFFEAGTHSLVFPAGRRLARLKVATVDDSAKEPEGKITASLISGSHYWVNPERAQGSVAIRDNDSTMISLSAVSQNVAEGDKVGIEVTAVPAPAERLNVRLSMSGTGGVLDNSAKQVILRLKPGTKRKVFEFETIDNGIAGEGGTVTVRAEENLTNPESYVVNHSSEANEITVSVADGGKLPVLSIVGAGVVSEYESGLEEGEWINFVLQASPMPSKAIPVNISMREEGSFLTPDSLKQFVSSEDGLLNVTFNSMRQAQNYRIPTEDDAMVEANGSVSLVLHSKENYEVNQSQDKFKVKILDNDQLSVSIMSDKAYVKEGDKIPFRIKTNIPLPEDFAARISIESTSDVLELDAHVVSVPVPANTIETWYTLTTKEDGLTDGSAFVTATLMELNGSDNMFDLNYEFVDRSAEVMVLSNSDAPVIQIKESKVWDEMFDSVHEGNRITFLLESNKVLRKSLKVNLEVSETGNFLIKNSSNNSERGASAGAGLHEVSINANQSTAIFQVQTDDDSVEEPEGSVTLKILAGDGYFVNKALDSKSVTVQDNDQLNFTLEAVSAIYAEGEEVEMRLISNVLLSESVTVTLGIDHTGDILSRDLMSMKVVHLANTTATEFSVATIDNGLDDTGGSVTVSIVDYSRGIGSSNEATAGESQSLKILLIDNEAIPIVSIRETRSTDGLTNKVSEGDQISFILEAKPTPKQDLAVNLEVFEIGQFLNRSPHGKSSVIDLSTGNTQQLVFPTGHDSTEFIVATFNDKTVEPTGSVSLVLHQGEGYEADKQRNIKTVIVEDNDSINEPIVLTQMQNIGEMHPDAPARTTPSTNGITLAFSEPYKTLTEGEAIHFKIKASRSLVSDLEVNIQIDEIAGDFLNANPRESYRIYASEDEAMIAMLTVDDDIAEENGLVGITISEGIGYTVDGLANTLEVIVLDNDSVSNQLSSIWDSSKERTADVLSMIGADFHNAMKSRMVSDDVRSKQVQFKLSGANSLTDALMQLGDSVNNDEFFWADLIEGADFETASFSLNNSNSALTIWGHGGFQYPSFNGNYNSLSTESQLFSARAGMEIAPKSNYLLGVAASAVGADMKYVEESGSIQDAVSHRSMTNSVNPYSSWASQDRKSKLGLAFGHGIGELEIARNGFKPELAKTTMTNVSLSGGRILHSSADETGIESSKLSLNADAWSSLQSVKANNSLIHDAKFNANQFRLNLGGSNKSENGLGNSLTSSGTMGVVWNSNDNHTIRGLELTGKIEHENVNGVALSGNASALLNKLNHIQNYGIQWQMRYQEDDYVVDFDTSISSKNDISISDQEVIAFKHINAGGHSNHDLPSAPGLKTEFGFRREIWNGKGNLSIFNGAEYVERGIQNLRLGSRLSSGEDAGIGLAGRREFENDGDHSHRVDIDGWVKW